MIGIAYLMSLVSSNSTFRVVRKSTQDMLDTCFIDDGPLNGKKPEAVHIDGRAYGPAREQPRDVKKQKALWPAMLKLVALN